MFAQSTSPTPAAIRDVANKVVSRPYFKLDSAGPHDDQPVFLEILRWLLKPFEWLFKSLEGLPNAIRWLIVVLCVVLCVLLIAHIIYTLVSAIRGPVLSEKALRTSALKEADPRYYEMEAELAVAREDYIGAIRLLFRAILRRLELFERKKFRPGITNRELLYRYRASPLAVSLQGFVNTIDLKWYGQTPCGQADFLSCRNEHERIRRYISESKSADRA